MVGDGVSTASIRWTAHRGARPRSRRPSAAPRRLRRHVAAGGGAADGNAACAGRAGSPLRYGHLTGRWLGAAANHARRARAVATKARCREHDEARLPAPSTGALPPTPRARRAHGRPRLRRARARSSSGGHHLMTLDGECAAGTNVDGVVRRLRAPIPPLCAACTPTTSRWCRPWSTAPGQPEERFKSACRRSRHTHYAARSPRHRRLPLQPQRSRRRDDDDDEVVTRVQPVGAACAPRRRHGRTCRPAAASSFRTAIPTSPQVLALLGTPRPADARVGNYDRRAPSSGDRKSKRSRFCNSMPWPPPQLCGDARRVCSSMVADGWIANGKPSKPAAAARGRRTRTFSSSRRLRVTNCAARLSFLDPRGRPGMARGRRRSDSGRSRFGSCYLGRASSSTARSSSRRVDRLRYARGCRDLRAALPLDRHVRGRWLTRRWSWPRFIKVLRLYSLQYRYFT